MQASDVCNGHAALMTDDQAADDEPALRPLWRSVGRCFSAPVPLTWAQSRRRDAGCGDLLVPSEELECPCRRARQT